MSDLISRSELIKLINDKYIGLNDAEDLYHGGKFDCFTEIKLMIKNQPTAYDIDKVVYELEADERHTFDGCINKRYAIEIVKAGVKNEN